MSEGGEAPGYVATTVADIPNVKVTMRDLVEEVSTLIWEKRGFLDGHSRISEPARNLALLRIRKLEVLHKTLLHLQEHGVLPGKEVDRQSVDQAKVEEKPEPAAESRPVDPEPQAQQGAQVEEDEEEW